MSLKIFYEFDKIEQHSLLKQFVPNYLNYSDEIK